MSVDCLNLEKSNQYMVELIQKREPFMISRVGIGAETQATDDYLRRKKPSQNTINMLNNNVGVYGLDNRIELFCKLYAKALENSTALAVFSDCIVDSQKLFVQKFGLKTLHSRVIEPFHCCLQDIEPWTLHLKGKKILIINPFVDSMQKQVKDGFKIFKDKKVFPDDAQFVFYKSYQSIAGNKPHGDWLMTFNIMCRDIKKLDFDIALLGCGGYGLPLCDFIHKKMGKSCVYVGGGLQLLFGVMGKRWENQNNGLWPKIIKENGCKFIRPSGDEIPKNIRKVEDGCYW